MASVMPGITLFQPIEQRRDTTRRLAMPVHVPAPAQPTDRCPKCGTQGVPQQTIGNMTSYLCPKCRAVWMATR